MKGLLSIAVDVLVFTTLFAVPAVLLAQFLPEDLAMLGYACPFVYGWLRGVITSTVLAISFLWVFLMWAHGVFGLSYQKMSIILGVCFAAAKFAEWRRATAEARSDSR